LHFVQKGKSLSAGACAALTALKPHLLVGFGILLLMGVITYRGRVALAAGVSVIALSLGIAILANPAVVHQYFAAIDNPGPNAIPLHEWILSVPAYWLRMAINPQWFWLQFLPCAGCSIALVIWRIRSGARWNWPGALPCVVAVSVLTAPYGWIFDLTVLLVPVVWAASRLAQVRRWILLGVFLLCQFVVTVVSVATAGGLHEYWWVAPTVLAPCLFGVCVRNYLGMKDPD
jgi:hypothetical protein